MITGAGPIGLMAAAVARHAGARKIVVTDVVSERLQLTESAELRRRLFANAELLRRRLTEEGFTLLDGEHPIIPVMVGDAAKTAQIADHMLDEGIYVTAFSYPVVPKDQTRIRLQMSAVHTEEDIERCVAAFIAALGDEAEKLPDQTRVRATVSAGLFAHGDLVVSLSAVAAAP